MYLAHAINFRHIIDTSDWSYDKCACIAKLHLHWAISEYQNIHSNICR